MKETIERLQDWYKLNCDGDWEHNYGFSITTLDNPGWSIKIDLTETCLEKLDFNKQFQNLEQKHDWYIIRTIKEVLEMSCGPENLNQVLKIFLDDIIPNHLDREYYYEIFLPLQGHHFNIWTPAKATIVNEETVKLIEIPKIEYKNIKVKDNSKIDFNQSDLEKLSLNFNVGDDFKVMHQSLENDFILTIKK
jgi:hypothetical protein